MWAIGRPTVRFVAGRPGGDAPTRVPATRTEQGEQMAVRHTGQESAVTGSGGYTAAGSPTGGLAALISSAASGDRRARPTWSAGARRWCCLLLDRAREDDHGLLRAEQDLVVRDALASCRRPTGIC